MIKSKKCKDCDRPVFSKGYCKVHQPKRNIKSSREKTKQKTEEKYQIRNIYFEYHLERCVESEESSTQISEPTKSNICHLIDKGRHPSLQDNLENYIYLTFSEHERFDKLLFSLEFDKLENEFKNSWKIACIRYIKLLPLCKESTKFTRELQKYLDGRDIKS